MKRARLSDGIVVNCTELRSEMRGLFFKRKYILVSFTESFLNADGKIIRKNTVTEWVPEEDVFEYD